MARKRVLGPSPVLNVRISQEMWDALSEYSGRVGLERSDLVRRMLGRCLKLKPDTIMAAGRTKVPKSPTASARTSLALAPGQKVDLGPLGALTVSKVNRSTVVFSGAAGNPVRLTHVEYRSLSAATSPT